VLIANQARGEIESLNYPNTYPHNSLCSWTIQASMGNTINYTFMTFDLEGTSVCSFDYVKVGGALWETVQDNVMLVRFNEL
jgi:cubilin